MGCQASLATHMNPSFDISWAGSCPEIAQPLIFAPSLEESSSAADFDLAFIVGMSGPESSTGCSILILCELVAMCRLVWLFLAPLVSRTSVLSYRYSCSVSSIGWLQGLRLLQ